jgi:hypothetical protein
MRLRMGWVYNRQMSILSPVPDPAARAAEIRLAERLARGVCRLFEDLGCAVLTEFSLIGGRRVDVIALDGQGVTSIVEIKSSVADFRSDGKWQEYLDFCDRFYFAVTPEFPHVLLPAETGLIVADEWHGEVLRPSPLLALNGSRRRAQTLRLALTAAQRLRRLTDPRA